MYKISGVRSQLIEDTAEKISKHLERVIPYTGGRYNKEDIIDCLKDGSMELWIAYNSDSIQIDGIVVTQYTIYPRKKVFTILLCSGVNMNEWYDDMLALIENVAKVNKSDVIEIGGRKGWIKRMKSNGYRQTMWFTEKEV